MSLITEIRNTIFDTLLAAYGANTSDPASSPYQNQKVIAARLWPSQMIDEREYGNAWSPTNPTGDMAATENISMLVDPIPEINEFYINSSRGVENMYSLMINSAQAVTTNKGLSGKFQMKNDISSEINKLPASIETELADQKIVDTVLPDQSKISISYMTPEAIEKKNLEIAHSNAAAAALAYRLAMEKMQPKTTLKSKMVKQQFNSEFEELKLNTWNELQNLESGLFTSNSAFNTSISIDKSFYDARLIFEGSKLASIRNPRLSYRPSYISPENWVNPSSKESWPMLTIPVAGTNPTVNLSITFSRVDITRPWLLASLFGLNGWKTSEGPGSLSTGQLINNNGNFSLLPQSMIVARDIIARTSDGVVYKSSGLQVLAYISKVLPYSPPL